MLAAAYLQDDCCTLTLLCAPHLEALTLERACTRAALHLQTLRLQQTTACLAAAQQARMTVNTHQSKSSLTFDLVGCLMRPSF